MTAPPVVARSSAGESPVVGYTAGVFDLFHMGHLNLLRQARERCDFLIAAVTEDALATAVRGHAPVLPLIERMAIVQSVRHVDHVVPQMTYDKTVAWETLQFDVLFAGSNVEGSAEWQQVERDMAAIAVPVVYVAATHRRDGSLLERGLHDLVGD